MSMVKNENHICIQGWMVNELGLRGNELIIYACIYGFSQADEQVFHGSLKYLCDWTNSTKQGVIKNLKSLIDKGLIEKNEYKNNNIKVCDYYATEFNGIKQSLTGYATEFNDGVKQSLPNNIDYNININNRVSQREKVHRGKLFTPPTLEEVQAYAQLKGREDLADRFFAYYTEMEWTDKYGKKVKSWKQRFCTWIVNNTVADKPKSSSNNNGCPDIEWVQDETGAWRPKK